MSISKWPNCESSSPFPRERPVKSNSASTRCDKRSVHPRTLSWSWLASTIDGGRRYDRSCTCRTRSPPHFSLSQLEELESEERSLVTHALLSAAFINFLSCATEDVRKKAFSQWLEQLEPQRVDESESMKASFCLKTFLTDEQELMQWRSEGLASDDLTVENALAILHVRFTRFSFSTHFTHFML